MKNIEPGSHCTISVVEDPLHEGEYFFEGTEKLLEIWFSPSSPSSASGSVQGGRASLRDINRSEWELLLKNVNCEILSSRHSTTMDAYLLSESSMFVSKDRIILKTCGKTTLLEAVKPLLGLAKEQCGFDNIVDVFYSHKNYLRPDLQPETYRHFDQEVAMLDTLFEDGAAYVLGKLNKDCWYIYTLDRFNITEPDQTLEIMMMDVNQDVMNMFTQSYGLTASQLTEKTGILDILPGAIIDDWLFEPCGYSMNALLPNGRYFTIHITPEDEFSYVSFETNVPRDSYNDLITKVTDIFQPNKFIVTLMANEASPAYKLCLKMDGPVKPFRRTEHQACEMKNYNLNYALYERPPTSKLIPYK
ncbi:hypothetical protein HELRODRAFT_186277 [Helobdella robusta]|uniref:S-adenosylmethionine decarboxylase proenzyme n=1 Tax=Helobdella robusta TaxID=6412 RepID=T1FNW6_HELRO|nr:hypothetical protein HELRODRAFT_186277 [Helobdella robusta]ESO10347.1 hypothetical protein HELRODRAFT_186277 [Helobdella robusta]